MRAEILVMASFVGLIALAACDGAKESTPAAARAPAAPAVPPPTLADLPAPWNEANLENGAMHFAKCRACHSLKSSDGNLVGPNLHGVFERRPGTLDRFRYSGALKAVPYETWTPELIDEWLTKPQDFVPGSAMFFNGIDKPEDRRDLISYLLVETRK
jgi:cytochrome c